MEAHQLTEDARATALKKIRRQKKRGRVKFNVGGEIFETFERTLRRFPLTLLGASDKRESYYCVRTRQYFFDRNRACFDSILFFYQSGGILRCPPDMPVDIFELECKFFQLPDAVIYNMKEKAGILAEFNQVEDTTDYSGTFRATVWNFLENPETGVWARSWTIVSLAAIVVSIVATCVETLPQFSEKKLHDHEQKLGTGIAGDGRSGGPDVWLIMELFLNAWFLLELLLRLLSSPDKQKFLSTANNWVDALAIVPHLIMHIFTPNSANNFGFLRILRLVRVLRLFRLSRHSRRLQIIGAIIKDSIGDLQLLLLCLCLMVTVVGSIMYHVETAANPQFSSIPNCLWWAIVTITTVGYGDAVPVTSLGRFFAACFMAFGVLTITLPVLSIVTKFMLLYEKNLQAELFLF